MLESPPGTPPYTPELARELRGDRTQAEMAEAVSLATARQWYAIEKGKAPAAPTWTLALIVAGRHPLYGPRTKRAAPRASTAG